MKYLRGGLEMVTLFQKQQIILKAFLEGKSQRQIAKEVGINRKTVKKNIIQYAKAKKELLKNSNVENEKELIDEIVSKPKYDISNRKKNKLTDEVVSRIEFFLEENKQKIALGQFKQQKKGIDIYESLQSEGFDIGYTTVCTTIRKLLNKSKEAYIKAEYDYGDICEFDWGEAKIFIGEELKTFQIALFTSAKGNYRYAKLFPKQDTPCFQEAHALFFEKVGKVYKTLVYDNMKVAVRKFVGLTEKEPTEGLLKLSIYYGFKYRFCNVRAGNEKGHVERSVEYVRRKAFAFKDKFSSLEEANEYLDTICDGINLKPQSYNEGRNAIEILEIEKEHMLPKMPLFDSAKVEELRVDKYSTIVVKCSHYSVPDKLVGKIILVKIYSNLIICYYEGEKVAQHERKHGFNEWSIKLDHFINTLKRKPGALANSTAMLQVDPRLKEIYSSYYIKKEKEFIELFSIINEKSVEEVMEVIETLKGFIPLDISNEKIKILLNRQQENTPQIKNTNCEIIENSKKMLEQYKCLIPESKNEFVEEVKIL